MKIIIKETTAVKTLSIIDPESKVDYISDFIGNTGALIDGQFEWHEELDAYVCDKGTYDWWDAVVTDNQSLHDRIFELVKEHGSEAVYEVIYAAGNVDLEDHAANVTKALDDAFGSAEQRRHALRDLTDALPPGTQTSMTVFRPEVNEQSRRGQSVSDGR